MYEENRRPEEVSRTKLHARHKMANRFFPNNTAGETQDGGQKFPSALYKAAFTLKQIVRSK